MSSSDDDEWGLPAKLLSWIFIEYFNIKNMK
jgi:hypothetical protein